jgi:hypothetical protein
MTSFEIFVCHSLLLIPHAAYLRTRTPGTDPVQDFDRCLNAAILKSQWFEIEMNDVGCRSAGYGGASI